MMTFDNPTASAASTQFIQTITTTDGSTAPVKCANGGISTTPMKLRTLVPTLVFTHWAAHSLALAASDASKSETWFKHLEKAVNTVYTFFSPHGTQWSTV